jgi:hypothetical protein
MTVAEAIQSFLFHCQYEKNLSPKTLNGAILRELRTLPLPYSGLRIDNLKL